MKIDKNGGVSYLVLLNKLQRMEIEQVYQHPWPDMIWGWLL
jgi:hypothetical protein